jgi:hypothetical protein
MNAFPTPVSCGAVWQRTDVGEVEETFRVRLRIPHQRPELRQARAHERYRHLALSRTVQCHDERCQLILRDILQLIDEHDERSVRLLRGCANRFQKDQQILFEVNIVHARRSPDSACHSLNGSRSWNSSFTPQLESRETRASSSGRKHGTKVSTE